MSYARYSGFIKAVTISKVTQKAREVALTLEEVLPINVLRWYQEISNYRNASTEFVFLASLAAVSSIVGRETNIMIQEGSKNEEINENDRRKPYVEYPQLYIKILCEPSSGKRTAQELAVESTPTCQDDKEINSVIVQVNNFGQFSNVSINIMRKHIFAM